MDMTHSQTINIADSAELLTDMSLQRNDVFPTKESGMVFDAAMVAMGVTSKKTAPLPTSRSADPKSHITSVSSTAPSLGPGFENFLAGLFKSNDHPSKPTEVTIAGISSGETQMAQLVEENQALQSLRPVLEGSINASRKMDTPLYKTKSVEAVPDEVSRSFLPKEFFPRFDPTLQLSSGNTTSFTTKGTAASVC